MSDREDMQGVERLKEFRYWKRELELADKREKEWREKATKLVKQYRGAVAKKNAFNLLWANTETLGPAIYNTLPPSDVRRRFRDRDPVGKVVADVAQRCLNYSSDTGSFDDDMRMAVLDALVPGRGVTRVRYVPSFSQVGVQGEQHTEQQEQPAAGHEAQEGNAEELADEQCVTEHVDWQDFRRGYARTWAEVPWIAFRHALTKDDVTAQFGEEIAAQIKYEESQEERDRQSSNKATESSGNEDATAEFWEIWHKEKRRVCFFQSKIERLIYPLGNEQGEPPIAFKQFWPIPRPLMLVEETSSLIPTPPYELYRAQADEVDAISVRINKIVNALKVRGVYDATLSEMSQLVASNDNEMISVENAAKWMANGGLEKAIWWMPVEKAATVLQVLYQARDLAKQAVYEISGIADVLRGATDPNETLGAQKLKANFASGRMTKQKQEVARYARDLYRLMSEVVGEKFGIDTLAKMSGVQLPRQAEQEMAQKQIRLMQASAAQTGQQPQIPPQLQQMLQSPSWEQVKAVLANDLSREYRIDVQTDATVAATLQDDMTAMRDVLTGIVELVTGLGPAVQQGAMPVNTLKSIMLSVVRRSKLGLDVEDAIENIQQPPPQPAPEDKSAEVEQHKQQGETQREQMKIASDEKIAQAKIDSEERIAKMKADHEHALRMQQEANRYAADGEKLAFQRESTQASHEMEREKFGAEQEAKAQERASKDDGKQQIAAIQSTVEELREAMMAAQSLIEQLVSKPRLKGMRKVRGADGSVSHRIPIYDDDSEGEPLMVQ